VSAAAVQKALTVNTKQMAKNQRIDILKVARVITNDDDNSSL
jgi:hypothetical protein